MGEVWVNGGTLGDYERLGVMGEFLGNGGLGEWGRLL